jgi:hypothetical protein
LGFERLNVLPVETLGPPSAASKEQEGVAAGDAVFRQDRDSKTEQEGDLISEYEIRIESLPHEFITVVTTGLEHCEEPNSGGFCVGGR